MKTDKNTWKGFFFFLLRLISVVAVVVGLFLAYQKYQSEVLRDNLDSLYDYFEDIGLDIPDQYRF